MRARANWRLLDMSCVPEKSGVYGFKDGEGWLYIGKSDNLKQRLTARHIPLQIALESFKGVTLHYILSESPLRLERQLIEKLQPEWNGRTARIGSKFPLCVLEVEFEMTPEQRRKAVSAIWF